MKLVRRIEVAVDRNGFRDWIAVLPAFVSKELIEPGLKPSSDFTTDAVASILSLALWTDPDTLH